MTNEQILKKAIEKAIKNGFESKENIQLTTKILSFGNVVWKGLYSIIFSHDFAKAFWGENNLWKCIYCGYEKNQEEEVLCWKGCGGEMIYRGLNWQYHLQQMVLEPESLKYLEKFLDEKLYRTKT